MPERARCSGASASRSWFWYIISPSVTSYPSRPASTLASVDLPEQFGPMMACTSPALISRSKPLRMGLPSTFTLRCLMLNMSIHPYTLHRSNLTDAACEAQAQLILLLDRKLHRQLFDDLFADAVDDHRHRVFRRQ